MNEQSFAGAASGGWSLLESESIDRMYLNVYVPQLQRVGGVVWYLRGHLGQRFASTAGVAPKTEAFVANVERFVDQHGLDLVSFAKHQRKDDITQQYLQQFDADEGVLYVGRAQEKARVVRTERRRCAQVLLVLSLQRQAVHQRQRIRQMPAAPARHRLRGAGQRHSVVRRPQGAAAHL